MRLVQLLIAFLACIVSSIGLSVDLAMADTGVNAIQFDKHYQIKNVERISPNRSVQIVGEFPDGVNKIQIIVLTNISMKEYNIDRTININGWSCNIGKFAPDSSPVIKVLGYKVTTNNIHIDGQGIIQLQVEGLSDGKDTNVVEFDKNFQAINSNEKLSPNKPVRIFGEFPDEINKIRIIMITNTSKPEEFEIIKTNTNTWSQNIGKFAPNTFPVVKVIGYKAITASQSEIAMSEESTLQVGGIIYYAIFSVSEMVVTGKTSEVLPFFMVSSDMRTKIDYNDQDKVAWHVPLITGGLSLKPSTINNTSEVFVGFTYPFNQVFSLNLGGTVYQANQTLYTDWAAGLSVNTSYFTDLLQAFVDSSKGISNEK